MPIWTTHGASHGNTLSEYMQHHGWPTEHTEWRFVDALDSSPVFGITGWYAGSHFRRLKTDKIDRRRLDQATDSFPDLPTAIDRLILKLPNDDEYWFAYRRLTHFLNGSADWEELEREGFVSQLQDIVSHGGFPLTNDR